MNNIYTTFDDVLILPKFSNITSRKDVDITTELHPNLKLDIPIISANMDTITGVDMAKKMAELGGMGILHRFCSIQENVKLFRDVIGSYTNYYKVGVSIGIGDQEKERFKALYDAGAKVFCLDVAHGAQQSVVDQVLYMKQLSDIILIVGNFATHETIVEFNEKTNGLVDIYKVGIGGGSVCSTRIKTGIGVPQLSAISDTAGKQVNRTYKIIADGGIRTPGDVAKAMAMGADAVMIGGMFAGSDEAAGELVYENYFNQYDYSTAPATLIGRIGTGPAKKKYRGSASKESYDVQNKNSGWRTAEGVSVAVPLIGPVKNIIDDITGGLRSSMTYTGSSNLKEFVNNATFIQVSSSTKIENSPHKA